ncbi:MAG: hypothetical protein KQH63_00115 [Desulfobulbaceae bacterium]|nr:hypothetical protein [Desulfobulbaceae bacterium]
MTQKILPPDISNQIATLYHDMESAYDDLAKSLDFTCQGCPDNCCDSYFQHHTYTEWAYLWEGMEELPEDKKNRFLQRAEEYVKESKKMLARDERPNIMCPINEQGLCGLYSHRLMICRLHGIPSAMTRPDGKRMEFPGCFRCQEIVEGRKDITHLDRTKMYQRLVLLEMEWLGPKRHVLPRVKMTLAEMLVKGPPSLDFCR